MAHTRKNQNHLKTENRKGILLFKKQGWTQVKAVLTQRPRRTQRFAEEFEAG
jgi:hypothetical protein